MRGSACFRPFSSQNVEVATKRYLLQIDVKPGKTVTIIMITSTACFPRVLFFLPHKTMVINRICMYNSAGSIWNARLGGSIFFYIDFSI